MESEQQAINGLISMGLKMLAMAALLACVFFGLSLGVGAMLNWLAPSFSWEQASLLAAIVLMTVSILFAIATLILVRMGFEISSDSSEWNYDESEDEDDFDEDLHPLEAALSKLNRSSASTRFSETRTPHGNHRRLQKKRNEKK